MREREREREREKDHPFSRIALQSREEFTTGDEKTSRSDSNPIREVIDCECGPSCVLLLLSLLLLLSGLWSNKIRLLVMALCVCVCVCQPENLHIKA